MTLPKTITIAVPDRPLFMIKSRRLRKNSDGVQMTGQLDTEKQELIIHASLDERQQSAALITLLSILNEDPAYKGHLAPTLNESLYKVEWYTSGKPAAVATKPSKDATRTQVLDMGDDIKMIKRVGH